MYKNKFQKAQRPLLKGKLNFMNNQNASVNFRQHRTTIYDKQIEVRK